MGSGPIIGFSIQVLVGQKYREPGDLSTAFSAFFSFCENDGSPISPALASYFLSRACMCNGVLEF